MIPYKETPWGVLLAFIGMAGIGAGITMATIVTLGIAPSVAAVLFHLGWGGAVALVGFGGAATYGYIYYKAYEEACQNQIKLIQARSDQRIQSPESQKLLIESQKAILEKVNNEEFRKQSRQNARDFRKWQQHQNEDDDSSRSSSTSTSSPHSETPQVNPSSGASNMTAGREQADQIMHLLNNLSPEQATAAESELNGILSTNRNELQSIQQAPTEATTRVKRNTLRERGHEFYNLFG
jgi:hypothetical protein